MIYAIILAAGKGSRMKTSHIPKQYIKIDRKSIIEMASEKFLNNKNITKVIIAVSDEWVEYVINLFNKKQYLVPYEIITGGETRHETIIKSIDYISTLTNDDQATYVISHDAARPFVSDDIINENIVMLKKYDVVTTAISVTSSIGWSSDGKILDKSLDRRRIYEIQTPQSFNLYKIKEALKNLKSTENITDICGIFSESNVDIGIVKGEERNIKITNDIDVKIANVL